MKTGEIRDRFTQSVKKVLRLAVLILWAALTLPGCDDTENASGAGGGQPTPPVSVDQAGARTLADAALANVGKLNSNIGPQTDYGNLGCAWAVDQIVKATTGIDFNTLSTSEMYNELRNGMGIQVDANNPPPGSIIISPTTDGGAIGHVGIVGYDGLVYSNSSRDGLWEQNYTVSSWHHYFDARTGTFAFVVKGGG